MKYCVIMYHSFEADTPVYLFNTEIEAKGYMLKLWQNYYNTELAENSDINESETFHDDYFAQVKWNDGCYTQFICTYASEPLEF